MILPKVVLVLLIKGERAPKIGSRTLYFQIRKCHSNVFKKIEIIHGHTYHLDTYSCGFLRENMTVCDLHKKDKSMTYIGRIVLITKFMFLFFV